MSARLRLVLAVVFALVAAPALAAAPAFPPLTGRVVDRADILSPAVEAELTAKLAALEQSTGRQLVVATLDDLQGYEIEDYGYQLGRAWGIGRSEQDDGALFLVAPNERQVRIEVGYGLEGVLTDALSSVILNTQVLPRFRDGQVEAGVVAGTDAIIEQLSLDPEAAAAQVQAAKAAQEKQDELSPFEVIVLMIVIFLVLRAMMGGRRRRRGGWIAPVILGSGGWRGGGGGGFGGGGFSGGGGSFGGGGASGRW